VIAGSRDHPRRFYEPWSFESTQSTNVDLTESDGLLFRDAGAKLRARLDHATQAIVVGLQNHVKPIELLVQPDRGAPIVVPFEPAEAGSTVFSTVKFGQATDAVTLEPSGRAILNFLAFDRAGA
jgi:hypothetical protein